MELLTSTGVPTYQLVLCAFGGASFAFLTSLGPDAAVKGQGIFAIYITFELNHEILLTACGGLVLLSWIFVRKVRGRESMATIAGLGFVAAKLLLAVVRFYS